MDEVLEAWGIRAALDSLKPGQRIQVVFEGVVEEPSLYPMHRDCRPAVCMRNEEAGDHVVLRYVGADPNDSRRTDQEGKIHSGIVRVIVLDEEVT